MATDPQALLIAEIGSVTTRVTLVDLVEGAYRSESEPQANARPESAYRLVGHAEVLSTLEAPNDDALLAVLAGAQKIGEATARELLRDGRLILPRGLDGDGVDAVVALTSAAGVLPLVITAVASDVSARSALHASRCTYSSVLQVVTLDDERSAATGDATWIERQVQSLMSVQPQAVLMAGGLEGGADDVLVRLAHIVALTSQRSVTDAEGQLRQDLQKRLVIYAGNSAASERVVEALAGKAEPVVVANLRPSLETAQLEPTRQQLTRLYDQQVLPSLPGYASLRRLSGHAPTTGSAATSLMTRYLARRKARSVLAVDVGSHTTGCYYEAAERFSPVLLTDCGVGYGASSLLAARGAACIARWLPFGISDEELTNWVLNKTLRPHVQPTSRRDLLLEHALAREALRMTHELLRDERGELSYDWLIGCGGVLAHAPHPGFAALTLIDGLGLANVDNAEIRIHLDALGLLAASGAIAATHPDAAIQLFELDALEHVPLATYVAARGTGRVGQPAVEVELRPNGGELQRIVVNHGDVARLPLAQGRVGTLTLRPSGGVQIGRAAPGKEVTSIAGSIHGGALGVLIDARGELAADAAERQAQLWRSLVALGAERGDNPFATVGPRRFVFSDGQALPAAEDVSQASHESEPPSPPQPEPDSAVERDLARLRETVKDDAPKRGWFRRK